MGYGKMLGKHMEFVMDREEYYHSCTVIVVVIAIVLVIVDVDDEEGEGGREDACFFGIHIRFHCIHIGVTKAHAACRRRKSFVGRCTSETIVTSADAACRRHVSFLRMMHHCIMAPGFQPKESPAN